MNEFFLDQGYISTLDASDVRSILGAKKGGPKNQKVTYKGQNIKVRVFDTCELKLNDGELGTKQFRCPWTLASMRNHQANQRSICLWFLLGFWCCWRYDEMLPFLLKDFVAMSDRYCIFLNKNLSISAQDLLACCDSCGDGCDGGYPSAAWVRFIEFILTIKTSFKEITKQLLLNQISRFHF